MDIALNPQNGEIYVADCGANCIHKIVGGQISRFAGSCTSTRDFANDVVDQARFSCPAALLFVPGGDAGKDVLYVAEGYFMEAINHRIRKITDGMVTTLAGSGSAQFREGQGTQAAFNLPSGLALAPDGALLVADVYNNRIRRIDLVSRDVTTAAGTGTKGGTDGPAATASFSQPYGVAVWRDITFITDEVNHRIRMLRLP